MTTTTKPIGITREVLADAIAELNVRFTPPDEKVGTLGNIDLTKFKTKDGKTAYLKMNELIGTMKLGKPPKTLRQRLTDFVTSKDYDKYSDPMKGFDITSQGGKVIEIQKILLIYRKQALKELRKDKTIVNEDGFSFEEVKDLFL